MCITTRLETNEPSMYRITDNARYSLEIPVWNGKKCRPYQADDVQLQFYMMSPYVFKTLSHDGKGLYFRVSNSRCVWHFPVQGLAKGLHITELGETVRPFRHDEYERFILSAFPYYGASFSTLFSRLVLSSCTTSEDAAWLQFQP